MPYGRTKIVKSQTGDTLIMPTSIDSIRRQAYELGVNPIEYININGSLKTLENILVNQFHLSQQNAFSEIQDAYLDGKSELKMTQVTF